jgi:hypothetical protein
MQPNAHIHLRPGSRTVGSSPSGCIKDDVPQFHQGDWATTTDLTGGRRTFPLADGRFAYESASLPRRPGKTVIVVDADS